MRMNARAYDLGERTAVFGENVIKLSKRVPKDTVTLPLIGQLVRSGTSVGANYCEADCAESRKDFEHKIGICKKEAKETTHWLRMIVEAVPTLREEAGALREEARQLQMIFISIVRKSRQNTPKLEIGN